MHRLPALLIPFVLLPMASLAQQTHSVTGQVRYLDRMAMPDDAVVLVEVIGADGRMVSETRLPTNGQQVPVPFAVDVPIDEDAVIRAGITLGAELVWLGDPEPLTDAPVDLMLRRYQPVGFNATFRCGDRIVRTGYAEEALVMDTGDVRVILQAVATASGARYDSLDDPGTFFWNRGENALISVADVELAECHVALPPVSGPYVARGNEPFWTATVTGGELAVTRPGMDDLVYPVTDAGLQGDGAIFVTANSSASLLRENRICHDTMSGMPFPETATLTLGADVVTGCGGDSRDLLTGRTWVVSRIGGDDVAQDVGITLAFDNAGRVAGAGGCNQWFAGYDLTGEGLRIGQVGATMMACADPLMDHERRFFAALDLVSGFTVDDTGSLVLLGTDGPLIAAQAADDGSAP